MSFNRSVKMFLRKPIIWFLRKLKYYFLQTYYVEGDGGNLILGKNTGLANTLFNVESGNINIGDNTIFGYNVMVLTGRHNYKNGKRLSVLLKEESGTETIGSGTEVPREGFDIVIENDCWVCSGAIIIGPVKIGKSSIICSGAVVNKDVPDNSVVAGIPGKIVSRND